MSENSTITEPRTACHASGFGRRTRSRFPLSLRMVEDLLAARGIIVSHQTVRLWTEKFGRHLADEIRRRSASRAWRKCYLDEVVVAIGGKKSWLWRAVDQDGFVLDVLMQSRCNTKANKRLMRKLLNHQSGTRGSCLGSRIYDTRNDRLVSGAPSA